LGSLPLGTSSGFLDGSTSIASYTVLLDPSSYFSFTLTPTDTDLDPLLLLYSPSGQEACRSDSYGSGGQEYMSSGSSCYVSETGLYVLELRGFGESSGNYTLTTEL
jgi:hypothetical protein